MLGIAAGKLTPHAPGTWWPQQAIYAADFVADRYMVNGVEVPAAMAFSFTRASAKLAPDQAGVYRSFASNELARTDRGAWLEPASTNHIRNNTNVGAVAGTVTLPNNWSVLTSAGLSREVVGLGTQGGLPFMDLRLFGTANTAGPFQLAVEAASAIAAAPGETWTLSAFVQMITITAPPLSTRLRLREDSSTGTNLAVREATVASTEALDRFQGTFVLANSSTAYARPGFAFGLVNGGTYDFTVRISLASLEQLDASATPILTAGAVTSRPADELAFELPNASYSIQYDYGSGSVQTVAAVLGTNVVPNRLTQPLRSIVVTPLA